MRRCPWIPQVLVVAEVSGTSSVVTEEEKSSGTVVVSASAELSSSETVTETMALVVSVEVGIKIAGVNSSELLIVVVEVKLSAPDTVVETVAFAAAIVVGTKMAGVNLLELLTVVVKVVFLDPGMITTREVRVLVVLMVVVRGSGCRVTVIVEVRCCTGWMKMVLTAGVDTGLLGSKMWTVQIEVAFSSTSSVPTRTVLPASSTKFGVADTMLTSSAPIVAMVVLVRMVDRVPQCSLKDV